MKNKPVCLVVEDNDLNIKLMKDLLLSHDYIVLLANNGLSGIDMAIKQKPDIIISDIKLPDISGIEVIKKLKENQETCDIPILTVTAFAYPEDKEIVLDAGSDDYISKPIRISEFLEKLSNLLEW